MNLFQEIAAFLIDSIFSIYILFILLRFLLAHVRADFYNPISQFLIKITNPAILPLRRFIPSIGRIDTSSLVLALVLQIILTLLLITLGVAQGNIFQVIIYSIVEVTKTVVWIYIIALVIQAVMSWMGNTYGNPMTAILHSLTNPILQPLRKMIPSNGTIDFTPLVAMLALYVILIILRHLGGG